ncbi:hypothetical protein MMYC01_205955 [Madurella mycetomatis]|uniref:Uncharacterized protein n=1 Tax=Madurella mycetomatis TaxID=100816 RepID=A0A175W236_9PEZI|nr:hypothetical protein MMYC01_210314 [Madurella mycetomatis]KXX77808.1 hypothetical protein MMYC01_205955 [Madurella mycetomatis]
MDTQADSLHHVYLKGMRATTPYTQPMPKIPKFKLNTMEIVCDEAGIRFMERSLVRYLKEEPMDADDNEVHYNVGNHVNHLSAFWATSDTCEEVYALASGGGACDASDAS